MITKQYLIAFLSILCISGAGCSVINNKVDDAVLFKSEPVNVNAVNQKEHIVVLPIDNYATGRIYKSYGEYFQDRFLGFHTGEDIEVDNINEEVPVYSIADGTIIFFEQTSGYGGVIVIMHELKDGTKISAIYGHVDLKSSVLKEGNFVRKGQFIANLGDDESEETDGERKHLHFALYEPDDVRLSGYTKDVEILNTWLNPNDFFIEYGFDLSKHGRLYDVETDLGADVFNLSFQIPDGWELEYVPELKALNLFKLSGTGTALERSQIFIRYFDASDFLTLTTVDILETIDLTVGSSHYVARRYDIEKKSNVSNFSNQPSWRNKRHIVTDFRDKEGMTRYYVVASNPDLDSGIYEKVLASMEILK